MKTRYAKTMRDAIAEVWANDITLDEGRMKTIATMFDAGKTPEEIREQFNIENDFPALETSVGVARFSDMP